MQVFLLYDYQRSSPNRAAGHWHIELQGTPGSVAYIAVSYLIAQRLPAVAIQNAAGRYEYPNPANIENAAAGFGITSDCGKEVLSGGVDVMTSGNHIYDKREGIGYIESEARLIRPANRWAFSDITCAFCQTRSFRKSDTPK